MVPVRLCFNGLILLITTCRILSLMCFIFCQTLQLPIKNVQKEIRWTKSLSKYYAKVLISAQYDEWDKSEYKALLKLWGKESAWDHTADNPKSSAFGIPQLLNMKPTTPAPEQIARGLAYIKHRYDKPSVAWAHWRKHNWY